MKDENWLAFISLEFIESHESYRLSSEHVPLLLVVPRAGREAALDDWLEGELSSNEVSVSTYRRQAMHFQKAIRNQALVIALLESIIAAMAAIALAALNHIFVMQRRTEFGVLHALGYGRSFLVRRGIADVASAVGMAWLLSVALCLVGLLYLQYGAFAPLGLKLDFFNVTPWLFTLPIPVAVLVATGGTTARALSRFDPISIVEDRS